MDKKIACFLRQVLLREKAVCFLHRCARAQLSFFWWGCEMLFAKLFFVRKKRSWIAKLVSCSRNFFFILLALPLLSCTFLMAQTELITRVSAHMLSIAPYIYLKGKGSEKIWKEKRPLTIFSLNTCFVPGGFSLLYGGVVRWSERIEAIVEKIQEKDPDILCLQEVNDLDAAYRLFEALQDRYAHFYFHIGPKVLAQNSGLFVASKFAVEDPSFTAFDEGIGLQKMVNKGFFDCKIISQGKKVAHLFTTHLSPSEDDLMPTREEKEMRKKELAQIFAKMHTVDGPILFAGDFNMARGYGESSALQGFNDFLPQGEKSSATDSLKEILYAHSEKEIESAKKNNPEVSIDYILFKSNNSSCKRGSTSLVKFYDLDDPNPTKKALSDHHALFARFYF